MLVFKRNNSTLNTRNYLSLPMCYRILLFLSIFLATFSTFAQTNKTWFREDFNNNTNQWTVSKSPAMDFEIKDGHYVLNKHEAGGNLYWMFKNIYMNPVKDFVFETRIKLLNVRSPGNVGFFITDRSGKKNFFCLNASHANFWVGYNDQQAWGSYTTSAPGANNGWQPTNELKPEGEYNTLKLQRKGNTLTFFINNHNVLTLPSSQFCSDIRKYIGFVTEAQAEAYIDYVLFEQDNWKDVADPDAQPLAATRMSTAINTYGDELNAVLTADQKTLFFTRLHVKENYEGISFDADHDDGDIYSADYVDGKWTTAKRLEYGISNKSNNAIASVSPDGNSLLLFGRYDKASNSTDIKGGVSVTHRTKNGWTYPEELKIKNYYSKSRVVNFYMVDNWQTLILCIEREDSKGFADFYVSFKQRDESWSEPRKMEGKMNTANTDFSPFLAADGKTLYFASWDLPGYGETDMFMTKRLDDSWTKWSDPVNMGPAINNDYFNAYYKISTDGKVLYYSSEKNSLGYCDIFMSELPKTLQPEPVNLIKGKVLNAKTQQPVAAQIRYENIDNGERMGESFSNPDNGAFSIVLPYGKHYGFHAEAPGYIAINDHLDLSSIDQYTELEKTIYMVPIEVGQVIHLNNVFFKQSLDQLLPISYPELDRLSTILKENPKLEIEIRGHTDNQGDPKLNQLLSEQRVAAVKKYLVEKGIAEKRMIGKGFGGSQPKAPNDKEENRKKNRRVEFVIIKNG